MDILLIHVPAEVGKKAHDNAFGFSRPINFGILAVASYVESHGYSVEIHDPRAFSAGNIEEELIAHIARADPDLLGLSCISGFSYPTLKRIASAVKDAFPHKTLVVGGQDHVGVIPTAVLQECQAIDVVVKGEGEEVLRRLIECRGRPDELRRIPNIAYRGDGQVLQTRFTTETYLEEIPALNYTLYPQWEAFPLSLEVSRGCPYSCNFCTENKTPVRTKSPRRIVDEVKSIAAMHSLKPLRFYFEAPTFMFKKHEILELIDLRSRERLDFTWRAQTRVEYLAGQSIELLAKAGLRVLDLGLESGSPEILSRMGKTRNPDGYLSMASAVLKDAWAAGVVVKLNVLFYIGETPATIRETLDFLESNQAHISAVSAYPFLVYPQNGNEAAALEELKVCGGSEIRTDEWTSRVIAPINPSSTLTYDDVSELSPLISKIFQPFDVFFVQKQYGYFAPNTTRLEVFEASKKYASEKLPFWITEHERQTARQQVDHILAFKGA